MSTWGGVTQISEREVASLDWIEAAGLVRLTFGYFGCQPPAPLAKEKGARFLRPLNHLWLSPNLHARTRTVSDLHTTVLQLADAVSSRDARHRFAERFAADP